ncbi:MAG: rhodanese-like domain-containing protein, partial [Phenylobacterium sp.]
MPTQLNPKDVADLLAKGQAVLFDVRDPDEFARRHVKGARLRPLASLEAAPLDVPRGALPIFTCRSGLRTAANCARLAAVSGGEALVLA